MASLRLALARPRASLAAPSLARALATPSAVPHRPSHRVLILGGGAAGQAIAHQLTRSGRFATGDIGVIDPSSTHDYQPGWTLVGGGLKQKEELRRPLAALLADTAGVVSLLPHTVTGLKPESNVVQTESGEVGYEHLVVAAGIDCKWDKVEGLAEALREQGSGVSSIYSYDTCDKLFPQIDKLKKGKAVFTQPAGIIKCAGAPQKAMWLAEDHWRSHSLRRTNNAYSAVSVTFASGMPSLFSVPKYSQALDVIREERGVDKLLQHNLIRIDGRKAVFAAGDGEKTLDFDLLHVAPPQGPRDVFAKSALADAAGYIEVNNGTLQHVKHKNVWAAGDASSLPTSKTVAAITAQAPVLVENLLSVIDGKEAATTYDGYTSCPLLTSYGKVMLAEFKYGLEPKETFTRLFGIDQTVPRRAFYHLKKDFFPSVYYSSFIKGTWQGPKGWSLSAPSARSFSSSARRSFSTSAAAARNTPARRPRDPLSDSPHAERHFLPSGETLIMRPPPTAGSPHSIADFGARPAQPTAASANHVFNASPNAGTGVMPPPLRPAKATPKQPELSEQEITEIRRLRAANPELSARSLAERFSCSATFIQIVAPLPKAARRELDAEKAFVEDSMGFNKRKARVERQERRALW